MEHESIFQPLVSSACADYVHAFLFSFATSNPLMMMIALSDDSQRALYISIACTGQSESHCWIRAPLSFTPYIFFLHLSFDEV